MANTGAHQSTTFLFTDLAPCTDGETAGAVESQLVIDVHDRVVLEAVDRNQGKVFRIRRGGVSAVFERAADALHAAVEAQAAFQSVPTTGVNRPINDRLRIAIHTGTAESYRNVYCGPAIRGCAALLGAAHGGQILMLDSARRALHEPLPTSAVLRDLGIHALSDSPREVRVWQIEHPQLPNRFPPIVSRDLSRTNAPTYRTTFVGRKAEIARVTGLLNSNRMVSLVGTPGVGKTRLAVEIGYAMLPGFDDGVWHIDLEEPGGAVDICAAIARRLGLRQAFGTSLNDVVKGYLRSRSMLLVLDGFNRSEPATAAVCDDLIAAASGLTILTTAIAPIGAEAERVYELQPLKLPIVSDDRDTAQDGYFLVRHESVRLFLYRARALRNDFTLDEANSAALVCLCNALEGLPFAIELAAGQSHNSPVADILAEILEAAERHECSPAQATAAWSLMRISATERRLLMRLSVFCSGWDERDAMEACGDAGQIDVTGQAGISREEVTLVLRSLQHRGLITASAELRARYAIPGPVLATCRERRARMPDDGALRRRHAAHYREMCRTAASGTGSAAPEALDRIRRSDSNVRLALLEALDQAHFPQIGESSGAAERMLAFGADAAAIWLSVMRLNDAAFWLSEALAVPGASRKTDYRACALLVYGAVKRLSGDMSAALPAVQEAVEIYTTLGDAYSAGRSRLVLAQIARDRGDIAAARKLMCDASQMPPDPISDRTRQADECAVYAWLDDDGPAALRAAGNAQSLRRGESHDRTAAAAYEAMGRAALFRGELDSARRYLDDAGELRRRIESTGGHLTLATMAVAARGA